MYCNRTESVNWSRVEEHTCTGKSTKDYIRLSSLMYQLKHQYVDACFPNDAFRPFPVLVQSNMIVLKSESKGMIEHLPFVSQLLLTEKYSWTQNINYSQNTAKIIKID